MDFSDSLGLLLFLLFLFLQFIASVFGRKKGKRPPQTDGSVSGGDGSVGEPSDGDLAVPSRPAPSRPEPSKSERPLTFEDALRQIQEALSDASRPKQPRPEPEPAAEPAYAEAATTSPALGEAFEDEEQSQGFRHFDDFEQHGREHFSSGAHDRFEAAEARREAMLDHPLATDRPTLIERKVERGALRGQQSMSEIGIAPPSSKPGHRGIPASNTPPSVSRLRKKLSSPEAVQDAYRLHVILGSPRSKNRRRDRLS